MDINEQKLNSILDEQRNEYQRYLGVLAEDFKSQIKLIAESMSGIQEQLVALRDMVVKNTEDIEIIKIEMFQTKKDIEIMKVDILETKKDIEIIKGDIGFIKNSLKKKVDTEEFAFLEQRVAALERRA